MVGWTVPEHERCGEKRNATCTIILCIYLSSYSVKSNLTCLVKKVDGYSTSYCPLVLSSKQSLGTCKEMRQCGPSHTSNEEACTLVTKGRVYWRRSRGCENNRLQHARTSPKNLGMEILVIYNIGLVSYFLPTPIISRHRSLLLPLAKPYSSEIIAHHPSTVSTPLARMD